MTPAHNTKVTSKTNTELSVNEESEPAAVLAFPLTGTQCIPRTLWEDPVLMQFEESHQIL